MQTLVVKLSDLGFLSQEDLENTANHADLGEKILRQFSFLPGELSIAISTDHIPRAESGENGSIYESR